ncbi:DUF2505 domain-containing protein [Actinotalea caeni]|uniref:DUF2505 domain-containing protein n=1 Tax=Actinotalea caeni TaxID=1348467 RepID=UPI0012E22B1C|nr:DUF2505 domain-containing protein [Actinotalea caeni]
MRPFQARTTYDAPVAEVAAMMADPAFVERKVAASRPVSSTVDVTTTPDGGFTVSTRRALPTSDLPAAAQRLVGATLELTLVERWGPAEADGSRRGTVELDVVGKPASASGTATLAPGQPGQTVLVYEGTVEARIPLVGGKIEEQAVTQVQRVLDGERRVGTAWLAERA